MNTAVQKRKLRLVVDTNILVSALNFGGNPARVMMLVFNESVDLYVSQFILDELYGVLTKKFGWERSRASGTVEILEQVGIVVAPLERIQVLQDDPDNRILECAQACDADYIISGDKDFLALKKYERTKIVTASSFLDGFYVK